MSDVIPVVPIGDYLPVPSPADTHASAAEKLLYQAEGVPLGVVRTDTLARAQIHATLAAFYRDW